MQRAQQALISWILNHVAGIAEIDSRNITSSLYSGHVSLRNVKLIPAALNKYIYKALFCGTEAPLKYSQGNESATQDPFNIVIISGYASALEIIVSWFAPEQPIIVTLKGVKLVTRRRNAPWKAERPVSVVKNDDTSVFFDKCLSSALTTEEIMSGLKDVWLRSAEPELSETENSCVEDSGSVTADFSDGSRRYGSTFGVEKLVRTHPSSESVQNDTASNAFESCSDDDRDEEQKTSVVQHQPGWVSYVKGKVKTMLIPAGLRKERRIVITLLGVSLELDCTPPPIYLTVFSVVSRTTSVPKEREERAKEALELLQKELDAATSSSAYDGGDENGDPYTIEPLKRTVGLVNNDTLVVYCARRGISVNVEKVIVVVEPPLLVTLSMPGLDQERITKVINLEVENASLAVQSDAVHCRKHCRDSSSVPLITVSNARLAITDIFTQPAGLTEMLASQGRSSSENERNQLMMTRIKKRVVDFFQGSPLKVNLTKAALIALRLTILGALGLNGEQLNAAALHSANCNSNIDYAFIESVEPAGLVLWKYLNARQPTMGGSDLARERWKVAIQRVMHFVSERRRRWNLSTEYLLAQRVLRDQYCTLLSGITSLSMWTDELRSQLCKLEIKIAHRDVIFALRRSVRDNDQCSFICIGARPEEPHSSALEEELDESGQRSESFILPNGAKLVTSSTPTKIVAQFSGFNVSLGKGEYSFVLANVQLFILKGLRTELRATTLSLARAVFCGVLSEASQQETTRWEPIISCGVIPHISSTERSLSPDLLPSAPAWLQFTNTIGPSRLVCEPTAPYNTVQIDDSSENNDTTTYRVSVVERNISIAPITVAVCLSDLQKIGTPIGVTVNEIKVALILYNALATHRFSPRFDLLSQSAIFDPQVDREYHKDIACKRSFFPKVKGSGPKEATPLTFIKTSFVGSPLAINVAQIALTVSEWSVVIITDSTSNSERVFDFSAILELNFNGEITQTVAQIKIKTDKNNNLLLISPVIVKLDTPVLQEMIKISDCINGIQLSGASPADFKNAIERHTRFPDEPEFKSRSSTTGVRKFDSHFDHRTSSECDSFITRSVTSSSVRRSNAGTPYELPCKSGMGVSFSGLFSRGSVKHLMATTKRITPMGKFCGLRHIPGMDSWSKLYKRPLEVRISNISISVSHLISLSIPCIVIKKHIRHLSSGDPRVYGLSNMRYSYQMKAPTTTFKVSEIQGDLFLSRMSLHSKNVIMELISASQAHACALSIDYITLIDENNGKDPKGVLSMSNVELESGFSNEIECCISELSIGETGLILRNPSLLFALKYTSYFFSVVPKAVLAGCVEVKLEVETMDLRRIAACGELFFGCYNDKIAPFFASLMKKKFQKNSFVGVDDQICSRQRQKKPVVLYQFKFSLPAKEFPFVFFDGEVGRLEFEDTFEISNTVNLSEPSTTINFSRFNLLLNIPQARSKIKFTTSNATLECPKKIDINLGASTLLMLPLLSLDVLYMSNNVEERISGLTVTDTKIRISDSGDADCSEISVGVVDASTRFSAQFRNSGHLDKLFKTLMSFVDRREEFEVTESSISRLGTLVCEGPRYTSCEFDFSRMKMKFIKQPRLELENQESKSLIIFDSCIFHIPSNAQLCTGMLIEDAIFVVFVRCKFICCRSAGEESREQSIGNFRIATIPVFDKCQWIFVPQKTKLSSETPVLPSEISTRATHNYTSHIDVHIDSLTTTISNSVASFFLNCKHTFIKAPLCAHSAELTVRNVSAGLKDCQDHLTQMLSGLSFEIKLDSRVLKANFYNGALHAPVSCLCTLQNFVENFKIERNSSNSNNVSDLEVFNSNSRQLSSLTADAYRAFHSSHSSLKAKLGLASGFQEKSKIPSKCAGRTIFNVLPDLKWLGNFKVALVVKNASLCIALTPFIHLFDVSSSECSLSIGSCDFERDYEMNVQTQVRAAVCAEIFNIFTGSTVPFLEPTSISLELFQSNDDRHSCRIKVDPLKLALPARVLRSLIFFSHFLNYLWGIRESGGSMISSSGSLIVNELGRDVTLTMVDGSVLQCPLGQEIQVPTTPVPPRYISVGSTPVALSSFTDFKVNCNEGFLGSNASEMDHLKEDHSLPLFVSSNQTVSSAFTVASQGAQNNKALLAQFAIAHLGGALTVCVERFFDNSLMQLIVIRGPCTVENYLPHTLEIFGSSGLAIEKGKLGVGYHAAVHIPAGRRVPVPLWLLDDAGISISINGDDAYSKKRHQIGDSLRGLCQLAATSKDHRHWSTVLVSSINGDKRVRLVATVDPKTSLARIALHLPHAGICNMMRFDLSILYLTRRANYSLECIHARQTASPAMTVWLPGHIPTEKLSVALELKTVNSNYVSDSFNLSPENLLLDAPAVCNLYRLSKTDAHLEPKQFSHVQPPPEILDNDSKTISSTNFFKRLIDGVGADALLHNTAKSDGKGEVQEPDLAYLESSKDLAQDQDGNYGGYVVNSDDVIQVLLIPFRDTYGISVVNIVPHPEWTYCVNRTGSPVQFLCNKKGKDTSRCCFACERKYPFSATAYLHMSKSYKLLVLPNLGSTVISLRLKSEYKEVSMGMQGSRTNLLCSLTMRRQQSYDDKCDFDSLLQPDPEHVLTSSASESHSVELLPAFVVFNASEDCELLVTHSAHSRTSNTAWEPVTFTVLALSLASHAYRAPCESVDEFKITLKTADKNCKFETARPLSIDVALSKIFQWSTVLDFIPVCCQKAFDPHTSLRNNRNRHYRTVRVSRMHPYGPVEIYVSTPTPPPVTLLNVSSTVLRLAEGICLNPFDIVSSSLNSGMVLHLTAEKNANDEIQPSGFKSSAEYEIILPQVNGIGNFTLETVHHVNLQDVLAVAKSFTKDMLGRYSKMLMETSETETKEDNGRPPSLKGFVRAFSFPDDITRYIVVISGGEFYQSNCVYETNTSFCDYMARPLEQFSTVRQELSLALDITNVRCIFKDEIDANSLVCSNLLISKHQPHVDLVVYSVSARVELITDVAAVATAEAADAGEYFDIIAADSQNVHKKITLMPNDKCNLSVSIDQFGILDYVNSENSNITTEKREVLRSAFLNFFSEFPDPPVAQNVIKITNALIELSTIDLRGSDSLLLFSNNYMRRAFVNNCFNKSTILWGTFPAASSTSLFSFTKVVPVQLMCTWISDPSLLQSECPFMGIQKHEIFSHPHLPRIATKDALFNTLVGSKHETPLYRLRSGVLKFSIPPLFPFLTTSDSAESPPLLVDIGRLRILAFDVLFSWERSREADLFAKLSVFTSLIDSVSLAQFRLPQVSYISRETCSPEKGPNDDSADGIVILESRIPLRRFCLMFLKKYAVSVSLQWKSILAGVNVKGISKAYRHVAGIGRWVSRLRNRESPSLISSEAAHTPSDISNSLISLNKRPEEHYALKDIPPQNSDTKSDSSDIHMVHPWLCLSCHKVNALIAECKFILSDSLLQYMLNEVGPAATIHHAAPELLIIIIQKELEIKRQESVSERAPTPLSFSGVERILDVLPLLQHAVTPGVKTTEGNVDLDWFTVSANSLAKLPSPKDLAYSDIEASSVALMLHTQRNSASDENALVTGMWENEYCAAMLKKLINIVNEP